MNLKIEILGIAISTLSLILLPMLTIFIKFFSVYYNIKNKIIIQKRCYIKIGTIIIPNEKKRVQKAKNWP